MATKGIDVVVVGADRVAANGDTANKIGTYQLAIVAKFHGVPFFPAVPTTTLDLSIPSGAKIHVEERPAAELTTYVINNSITINNSIAINNFLTYVYLLYDHYLEFLVKSSLLMESMYGILPLTLLPAALFVV